MKNGRQFPRRVHAGTFETEITGGNLHDDGQIAAGLDRDFLAGNRNAENLDITVVQADAVQFVAVIRTGDSQLHDEVDGLTEGDGADAEHGLDIDDADAADFHEMADALGAGADEPFLGNPADIHHIIGHQLVTALDELQGGFAFTDAAFPGEQDTDPVDIEQNAVAGDVRSEAAVEIMDGVDGELAGDGRGSEDENLMLLRKFEELGRRREIPADCLSR